jgi:hypothetical protein
MVRHGGRTITTSCDVTTMLHTTIRGRASLGRSTSRPEVDAEFVDLHFALRTHLVMLVQFILFCWCQPTSPLRVQFFGSLR